jgi:hypothetical protein
VRLIGRSVFTTYLLAFEVTSALLAIAIVGAVVLARRTRSTSGKQATSATEPADAGDDVDGIGAGDPQGSADKPGTGDLADSGVTEP